MAYWLLKSEPSTYSWDDLVRDRETSWDGVRNNAAALHLKTMQVGDEALFYHSGKDKAAVGIARITRTAYPDPGDKDGRFVAVDVAADRPLPSPVTLAQLKAEPSLSEMVMLKQGRLSVAPVSDSEWKAILKMAGA